MPYWLIAMALAAYGCIVMLKFDLRRRDRLRSYMNSHVKVRVVVPFKVVKKIHEYEVKQ